MNQVDLWILIALALSTVLGLYWGLIRQLASTFGLILAINLAGGNYQRVAALLHPDTGGGLVQDPNLANVVAFVLIVVGVSLAIGIVASIVRTVLNLLFLGWLDHLLGAVLGLVQMLLLIAVITIAATLFHVPGLSDLVAQSTLAPAIARPFSFVTAWLPPEFGIIPLLLNGGR